MACLHLSRKLIYISCCVLVAACQSPAKPPTLNPYHDVPKSINSVTHSKGNNSTVLNLMDARQEKPVGSRSRRDIHSDNALNSAVRYNDHIIQNLLQSQSPRPLNYARAHFFMNLLKPLDRRTARFSKWNDHSVMHFGKRSPIVQMSSGAGLQPEYDKGQEESPTYKLETEKKSSPWSEHNVMHFGKRLSEADSEMNSMLNEDSVSSEDYDNNQETENNPALEKKSEHPFINHDTMHFGKKSANDPWHSMMSFGKKSDDILWNDHNTLHFGKKDSDPWHNIMSFGKKSSENPWLDHSTMHFGKREDEPWHNIMSFGKKSEDPWKDHSTMHFGKRGDEPWHNIMSFGKKSEDPWKDHSTMHFGKRDEPWHNIMSFGKKSEDPWKDHSTMHFGKRSDEPWHNIMSFGKKSDNPWDEHNTMHFGKKSDNDPWHNLMSFGKRDEDNPWHNIMSFGKRSGNEPWHSMMSFGKKSDYLMTNSKSYGTSQEQSDENRNKVMPLENSLTGKPTDIKHNQKRSIASQDGWNKLTDDVETKRFDNHNTMHFGKKSNPWDSHNTMHFGKKSSPWDSHNTMHFGKKSSPWDSHNTMHFGKKSSPWDSHNTMHFGKKSSPWDSHNTMHFGKKSSPWDSHNTMHFGKKSSPWDSHNTMHFGKKSSPWESHNTMHFGKKSFLSEPDEVPYLRENESFFQNKTSDSAIGSRLLLKRSKENKTEVEVPNKTYGHHDTKEIENKIHDDIFKTDELNHKFSVRSLKSIETDLETKDVDPRAPKRKQLITDSQNRHYEPRKNYQTNLDSTITKDKTTNKENKFTLKKELSKMHVNKRSLTATMIKAIDKSKMSPENYLGRDESISEQDIKNVEPADVLLYFGKRPESNWNQGAETHNSVRLKKSEGPWESHSTMHFGKKSNPWETHGLLHFGKKSSPWESHNTLHFGKKFDPWESHNTLHFGKRSAPWESHYTMHFGKKSDPWVSHNTMHFGKKSYPWDSHNTMHFGKKSFPWEGSSTSRFDKREIPNALDKELEDEAVKEFSELLLSYINYLKEHGYDNDVDFHQTVSDFLEAILPYLDDAVLDHDIKIRSLIPDVLSVLLETKESLERNGEDAAAINGPRDSNFNNGESKEGNDLNTLNAVDKILQKVLASLQSESRNKDGSSHWNTSPEIAGQETGDEGKADREDTELPSGDYKVYLKMKRKMKPPVNKRFWAPFQGPKSIVYPHAWYASQIRRSVLPNNDLSSYQIRMAEKKEDPINSFMHFGRR